MICTWWHPQRHRNDVSFDLCTDNCQWLSTVPESSGHFIAEEKRFVVHHFISVYSVSDDKMCYVMSLTVKLVRMSKIFHLCAIGLYLWYHKCRYAAEMCYGNSVCFSHW